LPRMRWRWSIGRVNAGMCEAVANNGYNRLYVIVKHIESLPPFSTNCPFAYGLRFEVYCGAYH